MPLRRACLFRHAFASPRSHSAIARARRNAVDSEAARNVALATRSRPSPLLLFCPPGCLRVVRAQARGKGEPLTLKISCAFFAGRWRCGALRKGSSPGEMRIAPAYLR